MNRLRFTRVRDVEPLSRNNQGDAGLDFYVPTNLTLEDLYKANANAENIVFDNQVNGPGIISCKVNEKNFVSKILIGPHARILIPSGIKVLLEPKESMLMAANKSGISTKKGLVYTAEIVDSPYTGEVHIGVTNTSPVSVEIEAGKKLVQFIHVPIYQSNPEEIDDKTYDTLAKDWGTRGANGFGSGD